MTIDINSAPPATSDERCPRCDRARATNEQWESDHDDAACDAEPHACWCRSVCWGGLDCDAHAVDWRARCLAAEDARRKAEADRDGYRVAWDTARAELEQVRRERDEARLDASDGRARESALIVEVNELRRERNYLRPQLDRERDCGQDSVCAISPGCARHWEERNRELMQERDTARAELERLEALFQQTHGVHHSWVEKAARAEAALATVEAIAAARAEVAPPPGLPDDHRVAVERIARLEAAIREARIITDECRHAKPGEPPCFACFSAADEKLRGALPPTTAPVETGPVRNG